MNTRDDREIARLLVDLRASFTDAGIRIESMTVVQDDVRPAPRVVRRRHPLALTTPLFDVQGDDAA